MTVALHDASDPEIYYPPETYSNGAMRLVEWAKEATAAHELATALCETPFAGAYKNNPGAATAAILKGAEVGLTPVTSLGAFDLIQGQPAPKAITLRALVQSHGHEVILVESTEAKCVMKGRRRGSLEWQQITWSIDRARRLGLVGKDNWVKQPEAMLVARATGEICRLVGSDVILGIGYSAEELADDVPAATRRVSRGTATVVTVMPEPDLAPQTGSGAGDDGHAAIGREPALSNQSAPESPDGITSAQLKKMGATMRELGMTDRSAALAYVAAVIRREVTTRNDLTKIEAMRVIDALERDLADPFRGVEPPMDGDGS